MVKVMQMINTRYDQKIAIFPIGVIYVQKWPKLPKKWQCARNDDIFKRSVNRSNAYFGPKHGGGTENMDNRESSDQNYPST